MSEALRPKFKLTYAGKNITSDISQYLVSLTYTDKVEGESDEVEIVLEDSQLLWQASWYPTKGDRIELWIGDDTAQVKAGAFEVDEVEISGPPDVVSIRAQATGIKKKVRTARSSAHENVTVKQLAEKIASKNGLTVSGEMGESANIVHERISQNRETDLAFLKRVAGDYGIVFNVRDDKLVFTDQQKLEKRNASISLDKSEVTRWSFRDKSVKTYSAAQVAWKDPNTDKVVQSVTKYEDAEVPDFVKESIGSDTFKEYAGEFSNSADILQLKERSENQQQAEAKSKAALYRANTCQKEGSLSTMGNPILCAGNNINLTGFGIMSGKWSISESSHRLDKSGGYSTEITLKQVSKGAKSTQKPKASISSAGGSPTVKSEKTIPEIVSGYGVNFISQPSSGAGGAF